MYENRTKALETLSVSLWTRGLDRTHSRVSGSVAIERPTHRLSVREARRWSIDLNRQMVLAPTFASLDAPHIAARVSEVYRVFVPQSFSGDSFWSQPRRFSNRPKDRCGSRRAWRLLMDKPIRYWRRGGVAPGACPENRGSGRAPQCQGRQSHRSFGTTERRAVLRNGPLAKIRVGLGDSELVDQPVLERAVQPRGHDGEEEVELRPLDAGP